MKIATILPGDGRAVWQGLCNGTVSVRLSVGLSHLPTAAAACGGFAAVGPWAGNIDRLLHGRFWSHTKLRWPVDVRVRAPAGGPRRLQSVTNDDRP